MVLMNKSSWFLLAVLAAAIVLGMCGGVMEGMRGGGGGGIGRGGGIGIGRGGGGFNGGGIRWPGGWRGGGGGWGWNRGGVGWGTGYWPGWAGTTTAVVVPSGRRRQPQPNYLPYVLGGAAVAMLGMLVMRSGKK